MPALHTLLAAAAATSPFLANAAPRLHARSVASYTGNPLGDVQMFANPVWADKIQNLAIPQLSADLAAKAAEVAKVPSFQWIDKRAMIPVMRDTLAAIRAANEAGASPPFAGLFSLYNFPDRDCSAKASDGELHVADNGVEIYMKEFIDPIAELVKEFSDVRQIFIYEPDGLANLVTNIESFPKCAEAAPAIRDCTIYALEQLNQPNAAIYIDGGHAGWLGWDSNLEPTAEIFSELYRNASSPRAVRGVVTNVSNFNGWNLTSPPAYASGNAQWDESRFQAALKPHLDAHGFPSHFLVDQGRSGVQPETRTSWDQWCNILGAGFGPRPTADTGVESLDAVVWVKPGGEGDGTSNATSPRYDFHCGYDTSMKPAPESGLWFQPYFEMLLENANPAF